MDSGLTWRRFRALLRGLSPRAVWRLVLSEEGEVITDPAVMDAMFPD